MKIRKALAVVLSLAMTVTLMPATAFATTTNKASTPVSVGDGDEIPASYVELEVSNAAGVTLNNKTITLNLDNAKWAKNPVTSEAAAADDAIADPVTLAAKKITITDGPVLDLTSTTGEFAAATVDRVDDNAITISFSAGALAKKDTITVTFPDKKLKADGDEGEEITVEVDPGDSSISAGTYTIATISGGGTTATVSGSVKAYATRSEGVTAAEITIKENSAIALTDKSIHVLKMQLPKDVKWGAGLMEISGSLIVVPDAFKKATEAQSASATELLKAAKTAYGADDNGYAQGNVAASYGAGALYYTANDGRTLYVAVIVKGTDARQSSYIKPIIDITKSASDGDINLSISDAAKSVGSEFTAASGLTIAKVGEEGVTVSTVDDDALPTIVSGQITDTDNEFFWVEVKLAESVADSLTLGKSVDFEFADGVQVVTPEQANSPGVKVSMDKNDNLDDVDGAAALIDVADIDGEPGSPTANDKKQRLTVEYNNGDTLKDDTSDVSVNIPSDPAAATATYGGKKFDPKKANTIIVYFPVTVRADVTGDVKVTVSGKDFKDTELTVAKAVAPVTVEATVTNVVNGAKGQALADITVKENVAGYVGRNSKKDKILFSINTGGIRNGYAFNDGVSVKVTSGDIELKDKVHYDGEDMWVLVDDASTEASTFVISGVVINLSRTLAEGPYDLELTADILGNDSGNAVVENQAFNKGKFGADEDITVAAVPYINITTAADTAQTGTVANFFLDGSKNSTYTVNGVDATMDAAAYLDSNNRTMVPIRYVAYALGLKDTDISYNVGDSTATLSGLTNVVKVTTGSNVLQASNGNVTMDTVAVNNSGRLYVPARFIAQAMGAQVAWDQATKTVTITK